MVDASPIFLRQDLPLILKLTKSAKLLTQGPVDPQSPPSQANATETSFLCRSRRLNPCLQDKYFYHISHLPNPTVWAPPPGLGKSWHVYLIPKVLMIIPGVIRSNSCGALGIKNTVSLSPWERMPTLLRWLPAWQCPLNGNRELNFALEKNSSWSFSCIRTAFNFGRLVSKERRSLIRKEGKWGGVGLQRLANQTNRKKNKTTKNRHSECTSYPLSMGSRPSEGLPSLGPSFLNIATI